MIRLIAATISATLILAAAAAPALAAEPKVTTTAAVRIGDINLDTSAGARTLLRRVTESAMDVCASTVTPIYSDLGKTERQCVAQAVAGAISRLDAPAVAAEYAREFTVSPAQVASR